MFGVKKRYEIEYWYYTAWGYDNEYVDIVAYDETQAIQLARTTGHSSRGIKHKIYKTYEQYD